MGGWGAGYDAYGQAWRDTKRRYWSSGGWWRRRRCFWCRRANPGRGRWASRRPLQLNHLTYAQGVGDAPLWVLRPMCSTCHGVETWLTRRVRPGMARCRRAWAHAFVTFGVRWALNVAVWAMLWIAAIHVGVV